MSYQVRNQSIYWKSKRLNIDPGDFEELHPHLARAGGRILLGAKPVSADAASFKILSEGYAKDNQHAYVILQTKLKPIKSADAASFEAISETYAYDAKRGYYLGKRMPKCDPDTLTALHPHFATDGEHLFCGHHRMDAPEEPIDLRSARIISPITEALEKPDAILVTETGVYLSMLGGSRIEGADPDTIAFLERGDEAWDRKRAYQYDASHVYFYGEVIPDADPDKVYHLWCGMITDGERLWLGLHRLDKTLETEFKGEQIATRFSPHQTAAIGRIHDRSDFALYRNEDGVWLIDQGGRPDTAKMLMITCLAKDAVTGLSADEALVIAYRRLFSVAGYVFEKSLCTDFHNLTLRPVKAMPEFTVTRRGTEVDVFYDGELVSSGAISQWMRHASAFWSKIRGGRDQLSVYFQMGQMFPDADVMLARIAHEAAIPLLDLATALLQDGEADEAKILAYLLLKQLDFKGREISPDTVAHAPVALVDFAFYRPHFYQTDAFENTTNLAAARRILREGLLTHDDVRHRYDMLNILYALMSETTQNTIFFKDIIPHVLTYQMQEPIGYLRDLAAAIIEMALACGFRMYKDVDENLYHMLLPFVRHQIADSVNTDWNRARLIEALWALQRNNEAEAERAALLTDCPEDHPGPPDGHNGNWRNYRMQLAYGQMKAIEASNRSSDAIEAMLPAIETEIAFLRDTFLPQTTDFYDKNRIVGLTSSVKALRERVYGPISEPIPRPATGVKRKAQIAFERMFGRPPPLEDPE